MLEDTLHMSVTNHNILLARGWNGGSDIYECATCGCGGYAHCLLF
jgi:hypothetical protein